MGKTSIACLILIVAGSAYLRAEQSSASAEMPPCHAQQEAPLPENMVKPKYPANALRNGLAAKVEFRLIVAPDAKLKSLTLLSEASEFSRNTEAAIRKWRFRPVSIQSKPVETAYRIHVRFDPLLREANSNVDLESPQQEQPVPPLSSTAKACLSTIGGEVHRASEPGIVPPRAVYAPAPEFSEEAREKKENGNVTILLVVGTDGLPHEAIVACSSASDLNENAIGSVKNWKFEPGTKDGRPVAVAIFVDISFKRYD
ncbi:MAG: energy transducer TonB [Candidatus Sulfotelmatobacter sp.]